MDDVWVKPTAQVLSGMQPLSYGSKSVCGGGLVLEVDDARELLRSAPEAEKFLKFFVGSEEIASGKLRGCLWIEDSEAVEAAKIDLIQRRLQIVRSSRLSSKKKQTRDFAQFPHRFVERRRSAGDVIALPCVSSESRNYLTPVYLPDNYVVSNRCFAAFNASPWYIGILSSRLHWLWCETTSGKLETRLNYSNTMTWNTFPVPPLTEKNKADLTACTEDILLAREAHFPATIADLYDPEKMPENLRAAHDRNDEVLERIYIGRRFKNDTERLEKLFEMYTKMTTKRQKAS
jgi:hypothetical protein